MSSKVYFANMHTSVSENIPQKLTRLMKSAGVENINFAKKFVAIKIHFGEPGNLAYLRPNYAKSVADYVKRLGGVPFLTDANTLYIGRRKNAIEHLDSAYENGFSPFSTGCQIIIADGLKGTDEAHVKIDCQYVKFAKIGKAVMDADIVLSLNHFKGHESTGFGGAIKNVGMGCGSRAGKMEMHNSGKPFVNQKQCVGCGMCRRNCAQGAITFLESKATIDESNCVGCGRCIGSCPHDAVRVKWDEANDVLCCKMAEYAYAVLNGREQFHVNIVVDVSPNCDCHSENDVPIVPNIGMFASFDPVALDMACAEMIAAVNTNINGTDCNNKDVFYATHPDTDWRVCLEHAQKIGLGIMQYELIDIDKN